MISWFKKPKIVFDCNIPGVEQIMPIIPARDLQHVWVTRARHELANICKDPTWNMQRMIHTARCPGIFALQRHGWVMRTWQDFTIETYGNDSEFNWATPIDQKLKYPEVGDYVGSHPEFQYARFMDTWRADSLKTLLKINSGWTCVVPKGYYLLELPVAHSGETRFTTVSGFFSREQGPAQMNPQFIWHVPTGKTLVRAGTPIAQYILVPKDKIDMQISVSKKLSEQELFLLVQEMKFAKNFGIVKRIFGGD